MKIKEIGLLHT